MLILSNCLTERADEGCLKVANNLIKRLRKQLDGVTVASYGRRSPEADVHLKLNKLLLNCSLRAVIKKHSGQVLYVPFPARPIATALRVFVLSRYCKKGLKVLLTMNEPLGTVEKMLYRMSGAEYVVLSKTSWDFWAGIVGEERVTYLKTGVDTRKFCPVCDTRKKELKAKYGFDTERPVVLHVGHLNRGRNVAKLIEIAPAYQVLLVTSTLTKDEQDSALREELLEKPNIRIISDYIADIQEIYQLADVYFFPVLESGHCIDVPLSCLEAAACDLNVITTAYGEMREFKGKNGFFFLDSLEPERINEMIETALSHGEAHSREAVLDYDWENGISLLAGN